MTMQPWNILGTAPVEWRFPKNDEGWPKFSHVSTHVVDVSDDGCARGATLWSSSLEGNSVFIAFDWVEMSPGVPILTDPNAVLTNLCLVNDADEHEPKLRALAHVNCLVYKTSWQGEVLEAVRMHSMNSDSRKPHTKPHHGKGGHEVRAPVLDFRRAA